MEAIRESLQATKKPIRNILNYQQIKKILNALIKEEDWKSQGKMDWIIDCIQIDHEFLPNFFIYHEYFPHFWLVANIPLSWSAGTFLEQVTL